jgi:hypothetical protein
MLRFMGREITVHLLKIRATFPPRSPERRADLPTGPVERPDYPIPYCRRELVPYCFCAPFAP